MSIPLNIDWQQILLHLFNFAILAGGLYLLLYKPVKDFMAKRSAWYSEQDARAEQNRTEAEALKAEYAQKLQSCDGELQAKRAEAEKLLEQEAAQRRDAAKAQAEKIVEDARTQAAQERQKLLDEAKPELTRIAVEAAKKLCAGDSAGSLDAFLDAAERE